MVLLEMNMEVLSHPSASQEVQIHQEQLYINCNSPTSAGLQPGETPEESERQVCVCHTRGVSQHQVSAEGFKF